MHDDPDAIARAHPVERAASSPPPPYRARCRCGWTTFGVTAAAREELIAAHHMSARQLARILAPRPTKDVGGTG